MSADILDRLTPIFRDTFDNDDLVPTREMSAETVPEWDSLSHIRLIVAIERAFSIKLSTTEVGELKNVGQLADMIERHLSSR